MPDSQTDPRIEPQPLLFYPKEPPRLLRRILDRIFDVFLIALLVTLLVSGARTAAVRLPSSFRARPT